MFCRTQLAPMRQVGQVGATRRTSVGSVDVELNTACSCLMFFSCGGVPAALALAPVFAEWPLPQPAASSNRTAADTITPGRLLTPAPFLYVCELRRASTDAGR